MKPCRSRAPSMCSLLHTSSKEREGWREVWPMVVHALCIRAVANRSGLYTDHFFVPLKKKLVPFVVYPQWLIWVAIPPLLCCGVVVCFTLTSHAHTSCTHLSNTHDSVQQQQQKTYIFPLKAPPSPSSNLIVVTSLWIKCSSAH